MSLIENDRNDDILGSSSDTTIVPDGSHYIVLTGWLYVIYSLLASSSDTTIVPDGINYIVLTG